MTEKETSIQLSNGCFATKTLIADQGKILVSNITNQRMGTQVTLGYVHYINEQKLDVPILETSANYSEDNMTEQELQEWEYAQKSI